MSTPAAERRDSARQPVMLPIDAHLLDQDVRMRVVSVSRGGLYVRAPHAPRVGQALHVSLPLESERLEAVATVVRVEPGQGFAVRLSVPGREGRSRWASFLAKWERELSDTEPPFERTLDPIEVFDFEWTNEGEAEPE
jgi:hypothetical protein